MQGQPFWGFSCQLWISRVASTGARTALPILYEPSPHPVWRQSEPTADAEDGCRFTVDSQPRFVPVEINGGAQYFDLFTVVAFIDAHHTASLAAQLMLLLFLFLFPFQIVKATQVVTTWQMVAFSHAYHNISYQSEDTSCSISAYIFLLSGFSSIAEERVPLLRCARWCHWRFAIGSLGSSSEFIIWKNVSRWAFIAALAWRREQMEDSSPWSKELVGQCHNVWAKEIEAARSFAALIPPFHPNDSGWRISESASVPSWTQPIHPWESVLFGFASFHNRDRILKDNGGSLSWDQGTCEKS